MLDAKWYRAPWTCRVLARPDWPLEQLVRSLQNEEIKILGHCVICSFLSPWDRNREFPILPIFNTVLTGWKVWRQQGHKNTALLATRQAQQVLEYADDFDVARPIQDIVKLRHTTFASHAGSLY